MEPDNAERFQPDLSLLPAFKPTFQPEPVAEPSPVESAWTTPTLPSSPNSSTPSMEAELAEQLVQLDEIAALLEDSDDEERENEELRRRRRMEAEEANNPVKGKACGRSKGTWKKRD